MVHLLHTPIPPATKAQGRVHRLEDDAEPREHDEKGNPKPQITPFLARDAKGDLITAKGSAAMPKGIYKRKAKTDAGAEPTANDGARKPQKRTQKRRAGRAVVPAPAPSQQQNRFDVSLDLRAGAVTINAQGGSLTLAPHEVLALFAFLGRR